MRRSGAFSDREQLRVQRNRSKLDAPCQAHPRDRIVRLARQRLRARRAHRNSAPEADPGQPRRRGELGRALVRVDRLDLRPYLVEPYILHFALTTSLLCKLHHLRRVYVAQLTNTRPRPF